MSEPIRIVVTGASRGLGLELTRQWLAEGQHVFALARDPSGSPGLGALREQHPETLELAACDVADGDSVARAAREIESRWGAIDWLVNNAGLSGPWASDLADLDFDGIRRLLEVNTIGPLRVTGAMLPALLRGRDRRVASITSRMGSIADNTSGGAWGYRISKAALNMASANMAHALREHGVPVIVLHPGWVRTDMGGEQAPLDAEESCRGMRDVIASLTLADTGCFRDHTGATVPW